MINLLRTPRNARITAASLLAAVPLIGLLLTNRQVFRLAIHFLIYELTDDFLFVGAAAVWFAVLWSISGSIEAISPGSRPLARLNQRTVVYMRWARALATIAAVYFCLTVYLPLRYQEFSELHFPLRALRDIHNQDLGAAREECDLFIGMYPRKGPSSSTKDFTCAAVYDLTGTMRQIKSYGDAMVPHARQVENISLPVGTEARARSLALLKLLAGDQ